VHDVVQGISYSHADKGMISRGEQEMGENGGGQGQGRKGQYSLGCWGIDAFANTIEKEPACKRTRQSKKNTQSD